MNNTAEIYILREDTREVVRTIRVTLPISLQRQEKLVMGLLRNCGEGYLVDDSAIDRAMKWGT